jgi:hypothetical protein
MTIAGCGEFSRSNWKNRAGISRRRAGEGRLLSETPPLASLPLIDGRGKIQFSVESSLRDRK